MSSSQFSYFWHSVSANFISSVKFPLPLFQACYLVDMNNSLTIAWYRDRIIKKDLLKRKFMKIAYLTVES